MSVPMQQVPGDHPLMIAWRQYQESPEFANAKKWLTEFHRHVTKAAGDLEGLPDGHAFEIVWRYEKGPNDPDDEEPEPFITAGMIRRAPDYIDGELWGAFMAGYRAAEAAGVKPNTTEVG